MSGTETRRLTRTTTLRLSEAEVAALRSAAVERGLGPSALARVLVLKGIGLKGRARGRRTDVATSIAAALGELGRIGNNLNQATRLAHASGDGAAIAAVAGLRSDIEAVTRSILALREDQG